jgi:hypothetical protein
MDKPVRYFVDVVNPANYCPGDAPADSQGRCYLTANRPNRFKTHGALIGGPKTPADAGNPNRRAYSLEGWNDWRTDWIGSEQTLDYNAHYTMALAAAIELPQSFWTSLCGGMSSTACYSLPRYVIWTVEPGESTALQNHTRMPQRSA